MEFQVASDIHIEKMYPKYMSIVDFIVPTCKKLILAGDIGSIYHYDQLQYFFLSCKKYFNTVIFVPGNNEYYQRDGFEQVSLDELMIRIEKLCSETGIIYLNNSYVETKNFIIFGSTWWSHIPDKLDIRIVMENGRKMCADDFNHLHSLSRLALNRVVENKENKKLVVISHYCPTKFGTMNNNHKKDPHMIPYYFSSSEKYLLGNVDIWIFGHTHVFRDFLFRGKTRIISNADPRKHFFDKKFTIKI